MPETPSKKTPRDFLKLVFRHRWLFLVSAWLFATSVLIGSHWWPEKKYTGTARVQVRRDPGVSKITRGATESFDALLAKIADEIAGYRAIKEAIESEELKAHGLTRGIPRDRNGEYTSDGKRRLQELVLEIKSSVRVAKPTRSGEEARVNVSFTHANRKLAMDLPNALVKLYIERVSRRIVEELTQSKRFLENEVKRFAAKVKQRRTELFEFEKDHAGAHPDGARAVHQRIQELESDLGEVRRQEEAIRQKLARFRAMLAEATAGPTTGPTATQPATRHPVTTVVMVPNPEIKRLKEQIRQAKENLELTLTQMKEAHPTVLLFRKRIAQLEKQLAETPPEVQQSRTETFGASQQIAAMQLAASIAAAESELEVVVAHRGRLEKRLAANRQLMTDLTSIQEKYRSLQKQLEDAEVELKRWRQALSGVEMALAAEAAKRRTHFLQTEFAREQYRPSHPTLGTILPFAIFGGLAFGGGLVFLTHLLDRTITTREDARKHFGLPIYGQIGEILTRRDLILRGLKKWIFTPVISLVLLAVLGTSCFSVVLNLRYPLEYEKWKHARLDYVRGNLARLVVEPAKRLLENL